MRRRTHIEAPGMAGDGSARAQRGDCMIRGRIPREVPGRSVTRRLSGESGAAPFSRERDGVGERELRGGRAVPHPSGESAAASIPRERDGVGEREVQREPAFGSRPGERHAALPGGRGFELAGNRRPRFPEAQQVAACNPYQPPSFGDFRYFQNEPSDRRPPPLVGAHVLGRWAKKP